MPDAASAAAGPRPEPFTPQAAPAALEDLRARLRATRWPDAPEDAGWSLGTDLGYLRELVAYWADGFDWPAQEAALARLPRFRVLLGGLGIHFVHVRAAAPAGPVLPLVLCHGWPDSFWRYAKVIGLHALLAHRDDRLVDAHVPRERRDPARAARPPGRGAVRHPWSVALCPMVTSEPTDSGMPGSACKTHPSCTLLRSPTTMVSRSPLHARPEQDRGALRPRAGNPDQRPNGSRTARSRVAPECPRPGRRRRR